MEDCLGYTPLTKPFDHQLRVWEQSRELTSFAAFWEQGTGKTKLTIDTIGYLYSEGEINSAIVVAPNGVHLNWTTDELPTHMTPEVQLQSHAYRSTAAGTNWHKRAVGALIDAPGLSILTIGYDGWMTTSGKKAVWDLMRRRKCMLVLDESHRIKTPSANRTMSILAGGRHAPYRRILSGTPVTNGPFDIYSQLRFLDRDFWRKSLDIDSFTAFKSFFGVWDKGWNNQTKKEFDLLVGYQNLDLLYQAIQPISSRVVKDDVLDLPAKVYSKRYYEMTPAQRRVYDDLEREFLVWLDSGDLVTAPLAITRLLRLQQVLCGYLPVEPGEEPRDLIERDHNPRLKLLRETMEDVSGKALIWADWTRDIDMIMEMLSSIGRRPVRYDGRVSEDERERAKQALKHGDATDFVANSQMSEGLTLNEAKTTVYYTNSYKLINRLQTEDRNHRIGQSDHVKYIDLVCPGTRDADAISALVSKRSVASVILGDQHKEWIE